MSAAVYQSIDTFDVWTDVGPAGPKSYWIVVRDVEGRSLNTWGPYVDKVATVQNAMELRDAWRFAGDVFYVNRVQHRIGGWFVATTEAYGRG